MARMSSAMVRSIMEDMYTFREEMVPCFIGDPGIGKTQGIYEFAEDIGVKVVTFILSNTVPSEVSGIRMPDNDTKKMEVFDDMRMASLEDGDILFFDEILEAPPQLWSACLTLIQDRIMASGRKLPNVMIVAASNRVASPSIIPASTRDRFMFIDLEFDFDSWRAWFKRTRHVKVPNDLRCRIKGESDQYNILTPRRFTKLYDWCKMGMNGTKQTTIIHMFDEAVYRIIENMINQKPDDRDQILAAVKDLMKQEIPDAWDVMPLSDILEFLQADPAWEEIEVALKNTIRI